MALLIKLLFRNLLFLLFCYYSAKLIEVVKMALLEVITLPDVRLKKIAKPVSEVTDELRKVMDDMYETMKAEDGAGLASIQVGIEEAILVIDLSYDRHEDYGVRFPLYMINPEIIESGEEKYVYDEGCLSVPGIYIPVERSKRVKVRYLDYYGKNQEIDNDTFLARAIQHEMDHLKGIIMLDYLSPLKRQLAMQKMQKFKKKHHK